MVQTRGAQVHSAINSLFQQSFIKQLLRANTLPGAREKAMNKTERTLASGSLHSSEDKTIV